MENKSYLLERFLRACPPRLPSEAAETPSNSCLGPLEGFPPECLPRPLGDNSVTVLLFHFTHNSAGYGFWESGWWETLDMNLSDSIVTISAAIILSLNMMGVWAFRGLRKSGKPMAPVQELLLWCDAVSSFIGLFWFLVVNEIRRIPHIPHFANYHPVAYVARFGIAAIIGGALNSQLLLLWATRDRAESFQALIPTNLTERRNSANRALLKCIMAAFIFCLVALVEFPEPRYSYIETEDLYDVFTLACKYKAPEVASRCEEILSSSGPMIRQRSEMGIWALELVRVDWRLLNPHSYEFIAVAFASVMVGLCFYGWKLIRSYRELRKGMKSRRMKGRKVHLPPSDRLLSVVIFATILLSILQSAAFIARPACRIILDTKHNGPCKFVDIYQMAFVSIMLVSNVACNFILSRKFRLHFLRILL